MYKKELAQERFWKLQLTLIIPRQRARPRQKWLSALWTSILFASPLHRKHITSTGFLLNIKKTDKWYSTTQAPMKCWYFSNFLLKKMLSLLSLKKVQEQKYIKQRVQINNTVFTNCKARCNQNTYLGIKLLFFS